MATCPKCGGYLSDGHRCVGARRRITRKIVVALAGALGGVIAASVLAEHASNGVFAAAALLGAVLGMAFSRATGFE